MGPVDETVLAVRVTLGDLTSPKLEFYVDISFRNFFFLFIVNAFCFEALLYSKIKIVERTAGGCSESDFDKIKLEKLNCGGN